MGKDLATLDEDGLDIIRKRFGMLFQSAALFDSMTVGENVSLPLREHTRLDDDVINIVVKMKLELVGLRGFEELMPSQLSGGMKKRVGLARAIVMDPEVVFYDEPTAGLDPIVGGVIDKLILDLTKKLSMTSVVVTHDMNSVFRIADRVAMLHQGRIVACGAKEEIETTDNALIKQFVKGDPDGPVTFFKDKGDYLKDLIG
jgi:phospholipid/cholesterol/gamma-HCH transport system ATP-binding protein